jgi:hypothetical protein
MSLRYNCFISNVTLMMLLIIWQSALGEISYTANVWSSASLNPYFAITAHWAYCDDTDGSIKMKALPVACLHKIVMVIWSSRQHRDALMRWIETGNQNGLFVLNNRPVQIQPRQLLWDVRTRWDSTYQMIKRCIEMCLVRLPLFYHCFELTISFRQLTPFLHDQVAISII